MTQQSKNVGDTVTLWAARGVVALCTPILIAIVVEIRSDVKVLINERSGNNEKIHNLERFVDRHENEINLLKEKIR